MKWRAHRQWNRALGAERLRPLAGARDGRRGARDHNLSGAVQVRGTDDFALRRFFTRLVHARFIESDNRRHGAAAHRRRFLHVAAAIAHETNRVGKRECARGNVRRIFAEAVSRDKCRRQASLVQQA